MSRGPSESAVAVAGGKIFTFGSYRLRVHGSGSDIDALCVVRKHVSREDFFEVFEQMFMDLEGVSEVSGVPDAYVPIVKAKISGVPFDFLMTRMALSSKPDDLSLRDDTLLRNLDKRAAYALFASHLRLILTINCDCPKYGPSGEASPPPPHQAFFFPGHQRRLEVEPSIAGLAPEHPFALYKKQFGETFGAGSPFSLPIRRSMK
ncbi:hypothetical protein B0H13DRAFT_2336034 [Mycena leptocephala]|nr:hypothetical protein B0H13DRAFT_2336034 [Mycena leptocephala]